MHPFIIAQLSVGAILLSVALLYGVVAWKDYRKSVSVPLALASFFGAAEAFSAPWSYLGGDISHVIVGMKISTVSVGLSAVFLVWFGAGYGSESRRRVPIFVSVYGVILMALHIILPAGVLVPVGKLHPGLIFVNAFGVSSIIYLVWVCFRLWKHGERRRAVSLGIGLASLVFIAYPDGFLVNRGTLPPPNLYPFSLLSLVLVVTLSLLDEALQSGRLAKEVDSNERRWRSLLENVSLLVAGCDVRGRLNYVNPFMAELMGYRREELLSTEFRKLSPPGGRDQVAQEIERVLQDGEGSKGFRFALKTKSGAERTIAWSSVPLCDADGPVSGILGVGADITDQLVAERARDEALKELLELKSRLETENTYLKQEMEASTGQTEIIGRSDAMHYVLHKIKQVAPTDATVLIEGETGVGKELVARALHENSQRARYPFIRVNCAALAPTLVESELFGHERGAFTGAERLRKGRFELAEGGTLFLDEIGELSLEIQAKLLRALQDGEYERVGGSDTRKANVRVIAATNRVLGAEITAGRFREDLFYRLQIYPISIPPLRERREDIPLLAEHLTRRLAIRHGKTIEEIPGHLMSQLTGWDWPGNVRELENVIERAVIISRGRVLAFPDDFAAVRNAQKLSTAPNLATISDVERKHIIRVLGYTHGRVAGEGGAAEILGLHPNTLRSRMAKLGVRRSDSDETPLAASATA
jgi:PAS domain S-box-containing protein